MNSPAQTLVHLPLSLIFRPSRQSLIDVIITFDKILQFPLIPRCPAAQGTFVAAPILMHLSIFLRHFPGQHGGARRFGLYIAVTPITPSRRSSVKKAVELLSESILSSITLAFTTSIITYISVIIKIPFEPKFILIYVLAETCNKVF